jgi:hypothetical protein
LAEFVVEGLEPGGELFDGWQGCRKWLQVAQEIKKIQVDLTRDQPPAVLRFRYEAD